MMENLQSNAMMERRVRVIAFNCDDTDITSLPTLSDSRTTGLERKDDCLDAVQSLEG